MTSTPIRIRDTKWRATTSTSTKATPSRRRRFVRIESLCHGLQLQRQDRRAAYRSGGRRRQGGTCRRGTYDHGLCRGRESEGAWRQTLSGRGVPRRIVEQPPGPIFLSMTACRANDASVPQNDEAGVRSPASLFFCECGFVRANGGSVCVYVCGLTLSGRPHPPLPPDSRRLISAGALRACGAGGRCRGGCRFRW